MREIQMSIKEIEDMFRQVICNILGENPQNSGGRVRFAWGASIDSKSMSAPLMETEEDVCIIQITPEDNMYNRQRDIRYLDRGVDRDMDTVDEHTDVHNVLFINYGNNAYECARKIRDGLYLSGTRRFLRQHHFALVPDIPAPRRVPELVNGNWVNRCDVSAVFNQFVRIVNRVEAIESVNITIIQENGNTRTVSADVDDVTSA